MCKKIVQDINDDKYGEDSALGKDQLGLLKKELREAILSELWNYITLENAGRAGMPNTLKLSKTSTLVLKPHTSLNNIK